MKNLGRKIGFAIYQYPTNLPQEERNSLNPDQLEELMKNIELEATKEANNNNGKSKKKIDVKFVPEFGYTKEVGVRTQFFVFLCFCGLQTN